MKKQTHLAGPALLIGANLPDLDVLAFIGGTDFQFGFRRGWTHGVLGLAVLPLLLAGALMLYRRWAGGPAKEGSPLRPSRLVALSYLATFTHPALDWLNTYGMRWLMPLDRSWSYGDTLFIVDPWVWLILGGPVALLHSGTGRSKAIWSLIAVLSTALIVGTSFAPPVAKLAWLAGLAAIVTLRTLRVAPRGPVVTVALATVVTYVGAMSAGSWIARNRASRWFDERGIVISGVMAGPLPANPFLRDIVGVAPAAHHFALVDLLSDTVEAAGPVVSAGEGPAARAARDAPQLAGFMSWARFPAFDVRPLDDGYRVWVRDSRYSRQFNGFGTAWVDLDHELRPIRASIAR